MIDTGEGEGESIDYTPQISLPLPPYQPVFPPGGKGVGEGEGRIGWNGGIILPPRVSLMPHPFPRIPKDKKPIKLVGGGRDRGA